MTRKEAKIILQCRGNGYTEDEFNEALEIAYSALDSSHLSNLDEAEFKYAQSLDEIPANQEEEKMIYDAFKAGAEWMAEQGETVDGYITDEIAYNGIAVILDNEGQLKPDDKVIVQIRKKEE